MTQRSRKRWSAKSLANVEAMLWNINPFDQWGVELGKQIAVNTLQAMQVENAQGFDSATQAVLSLLKIAKEKKLWVR